MSLFTKDKGKKAEASESTRNLDEWTGFYLRHKVEQTFKDAGLYLIRYPIVVGQLVTSVECLGIYIDKDNHKVIIYQTYDPKLTYCEGDCTTKILKTFYDFECPKAFKSFCRFAADFVNEFDHYNLPDSSVLLMSHDELEDLCCDHVLEGDPIQLFGLWNYLETNPRMNAELKYFAKHKKFVDDKYAYHVHGFTAGEIANWLCVHSREYNISKIKYLPWREIFTVMVAMDDDDRVADRLHYYMNEADKLKTRHPNIDEDSYRNPNGDDEKQWYCLMWRIYSVIHHYVH